MLQGFPSYINQVYAALRRAAMPPHISRAPAPQLVGLSSKIRGQQWFLNLAHEPIHALRKFAARQHMYRR